MPDGSRLAANRPPARASGRTKIDLENLVDLCRCDSTNQPKIARMIMPWFTV